MLPRSVPFRSRCTSVGNSRVARGRATQRMAAAFLQRWFPRARSVEAFAKGRDILETPGLYVEVKATADNPVLAGLRQAHAGVEADGSGDVPIVLWRPNGSGEANIEDWPVAMRLSTFIRLAEKARILPDDRT